jgi:hypothetical protein
MTGEAGGWMWLLIDVAGMVLLGAALGYGVWAFGHRRRTAALERLRNQKTEELQRQRDPDERAPLRG